MKKNILGIFVVVFLTFFVYNVFASGFLSVDLVNQDPDPAFSGGIVEVRIGVENTARSSSSNIVLEFEEEFPFSMVPGESTVKEVGTLGAYQAYDNFKILKYKLSVDKDARAGRYELVFWQYAKGQRDSKIQKIVLIDIKSKESVEIASINKNKILPGELTDLIFTINNVGSSSVSDIRFSWENEDGIILPVGSSNTKYVSFIDVDESADINYQVISDSNADPGLYKLKMYLLYDDSISGETNEVSAIAGIYVGGETDFEVSFAESSGGDTSFNIANIGSNPAYSVAVKIPEQQNWRTTGSNSVIIGNLNKGDYTVATFSLQQVARRNVPVQSQDRDSFVKDENIEDVLMKRLEAQKENSVSSSANFVLVRIEYTDTMGKRNFVEKKVIMNAFSSSVQTTDIAREGMMMPGGRAFRTMNNQGFVSKYKNYFLVFGIVLFGIVFFVFYKKYKRKKIENPKFKFMDLFRKKKK
jgi:hypothetical protein